MAETTDDNATAGEAATADRQDDRSAQPPLVVHAQYVKDLSFEIPKAPEAFARLREAPQVGVEVDVRARQLAETSFEVTLHLDARGEAGGEALFILDLDYGGVFTANAVPAEQLRPLLLIECPRLLFPFARGVIATVTREGGIPPLLINPIDFAELYRRRLRHEAASAAAAPPEPAPTS
jgi:preprotein translocase subunit SecB